MAGIENNVVFGGGFKLTESSTKDILNMQDIASDVSTINFDGDPEGFVSANPSSICHDPSTGNFYIKNSGTGNTGWGLAGVVEIPALLSLGIFAGITAPEGTLLVNWDDAIIDNKGQYSAGVYNIIAAASYKFRFSLTVSSTAGFITCQAVILINGNTEIFRCDAMPTYEDPNVVVAQGFIDWPMDVSDTVSIVFESSTVGGTDVTLLPPDDGYMNTFYVQQL